MERQLNKAEIYDLIIKVYGAEAQHVVAMEECAELIKAISKYLRTEDIEDVDNLIEEIADVEIMIEQLKLIHNIEGSVKLIKDEKITRTYDRIREAVHNG